MSKIPTRKQLERWSKSKSTLQTERKAALSTPITMEQVLAFVRRLVAVSFCPDSECWLYVGNRNSLTPSTMSLKTTSYASYRHTGEVIGAHQFAYAASEGILLSEIDGDVHHLPRVCIGYRCCNPDHLLLMEHREHARIGKKENAYFAARVVERQCDMVQTIILDTPPRDKRPPEFKPITGAGSLQRFFGGLPFLIRRGEIAVLEGVRDNLLHIPENC